MRNKKKSLVKAMLVAPACIFILTVGTALGNESKKSLLKQSFEGIATPISTITINMGFNDMDRGFITYTPSPGTFFEGPILDSNDKIIKQGDLLIDMAKEYRIADVENAKATIAKDEAILNEKKEIYLRDKKLNKTHSVSLQSYQEAYSEYLQTEAQLKADKAALILKERILSFCEYHARFDGIVNKIIFSAGYTGGERPIMEVSQLFPMGIDIKMPRALASQIKVNTPITIYPLNKTEPVGALHGTSRLTKDGIQILVNNFPNSDLYKEVNGKKLPIIHDTYTVMPFDFLNQSKLGLLAINIKCIVKDPKGNYVLRAVNQKNGQPGRGIDSIIKIEKIKIIEGNRINRITPSVYYTELTDPGSLKPDDLIISANEITKSNLKDGDTVYYFYKKERYLFMPGDPVKVIIGK